MAEQVLRHGSLFSGIGGFDLAAEWCGWRNIFHCEINEFCNHVLNFYWPKAASIKNIIGYEWEKWKGKIDVLSGGFPCQPYSTAGKRLGKADPRHLWPYMLKAIRAIRPTWVVGENVRGLTNWNGGVVFNEVQADLEAAGYEVLPFLLPAAGVNAPHQRERIWFIAYRTGVGRNEKRGKGDKEQKTPAIGTKLFSGVKRPDEIGPPAYTDHGKQREQSQCGTEDRRGSSASWSFIGLSSGVGDSSRNTTEGIRQLESGAGRLQTDATNPGSVGCNDRCDSWQEGSIQNDQRPSEKDQPERQERQCRLGATDLFSADSGGTGLEGKTGQRIQDGARGTDNSHDAKPAWFSRIPGWENFPQTQPAVRIGDDGLPGPLDLDTVFNGIPYPIKPISFSKWRTESIKAYGNAIVPQVAFQLFQVIELMTGSKKKKP